MTTADDLLSAAVKRELAQVPGTKGRARLVRILPDGQVTTLPAETRQQLNVLIAGGFAELGEAMVPVPWRGGPVQGRLVVPTGTGRTYLRNWQTFGPCGGEDPELFFPAGYNGPALTQVAKAKAVCKGCPALVRARCLREHMADQDGIFGGTTPDERRQLRQRELTRRLNRTSETLAAAAAEPEWDDLDAEYVRSDAAAKRRRNADYQRERRHRQAQAAAPVAARTEGAA